MKLEADLTFSLQRVLIGQAAHSGTGLCWRERSSMPMALSGVVGSHESGMDILLSKYKNVQPQKSALEKRGDPSQRRQGLGALCGPCHIWKGSPHFSKTLFGVCLEVWGTGLGIRKMPPHTWSWGVGDPGDSCPRRPRQASAGSWGDLGGFLKVNKISLRLSTLWHVCIHASLKLSENFERTGVPEMGVG